MKQAVLQYSVGLGFGQWVWHLTVKFIVLWMYSNTYHGVNTCTVDISSSFVLIAHRKYHMVKQLLTLYQLSSLYQYIEYLYYSISFIQRLSIILYNTSALPSIKKVRGDFEGNRTPLNFQGSSFHSIPWNYHFLFLEYTHVLRYCMSKKSCPFCTVCPGSSDPFLYS